MLADVYEVHSDGSEKPIGMVVCRLDVWFEIALLVREICTAVCTNHLHPHEIALKNQVL